MEMKNRAGPAAASQRSGFGADGAECCGGRSERRMRRREEPGGPDLRTEGVRAVGFRCGIIPIFRIFAVDFG